MKNAIYSAIAVLLAACGGGSGGDGSGQLSIGISDAPVDMASSVVVVFQGVSVKPQGSPAQTITLDTPMSIDLLDFQNGERAMLLDGHTLAAGEYSWLRLMVDTSASYIEIDGQQHMLEIPSGAETGLKLNRNFTVGVGALTDFTLDFDLRKSVHMEGMGDYKLRPTIRIVDNLSVGSISGTVADSLVIGEACNNGDNDDIGNQVYLFAGADQLVQDVQGNSGDPLTSAEVTYNDSELAYQFTLGFVPAGDYTLAFTCDASLDDPAADNSGVVLFSAPLNVSVVEGETTTVNIESP